MRFIKSTTKNHQKIGEEPYSPKYALSRDSGWQESGVDIIWIANYIQVDISIFSISQTSGKTGALYQEKRY